MYIYHLVRTVFRYTGCEMGTVLHSDSLHNDEASVYPHFQTFLLSSFQSLAVKLEVAKLNFARCWGLAHHGKLLRGVR